MKNNGLFFVPPHTRKREPKSGYMKYPLERLKESLKERLSLYKHELLLFERKRILKKDDRRQGAAKTFKKIMSVGYKKFRMRAIDGYARISQTNIFKCYIE